MISQLAPAFGRVSVEVQPSDLFLRKGSWVKFSPRWPGDFQWASDKLFEVTNQPVVVKFPMSWTIPGGDYKDINLANLPTGFSTSQLNLYPNVAGVIYQAGIGIQKGDFFIQLGIPAAAKYIYSLGASYMYPDLADASRKYLGQKNHQDSPIDAPLWFLYFIYNVPYIFLRVYALEGKDFEKCTVVFWVNKCGLTSIPVPSKQDFVAVAKYQDMEKKALLLPWYEELSQF